MLVRQRAEHIRLDELLQELDRTDVAGQADVLQRISTLVFPHAFAEESVLWPVMRRVLPDGEALTLQVEREHQEVNALVTRLERLDPADAERPAVLARLVEVLREDVRDEEDVLFPRLHAALPPERLRSLGLLWEAVRRVAPTRPHPVVARRPPGNVIAAVPLSVIDRLRDLVDAGARRSPGARVPAALGDGLAGLAHAVEHLPSMRSGEDPSTRVPRRRASRALTAFGVVLIAVGLGAVVRRVRAA